MKVFRKLSKQSNVPISIIFSFSLAPVSSSLDKSSFPICYKVTHIYNRRSLFCTEKQKIIVLVSFKCCRCWCIVMKLVVYWTLCCNFLCILHCQYIWGIVWYQQQWFYFTTTVIRFYMSYLHCPSRISCSVKLSYCKECIGASILYFR